MSDWKHFFCKAFQNLHFHGDLVYIFRTIICKNDVPCHFKKIIVRYKKIGYNKDVLRQTACLVINPIKINSFAYLFNCTTVGRAPDWMMVASETLRTSNTGGWWVTPIPGCLRSGLSWFNWWVSLALEFQCCYFCESSCLFYLSFNSDFYVSKIMHLWAGNFPRKPNN